MCWFMTIHLSHNIWIFCHISTFVTPAWRKNMHQKPCALNHVIWPLYVHVINLWHWFWSHKALWHLIFKSQLPTCHVYPFHIFLLIFIEPLNNYTILTKSQVAKNYNIKLIDPCSNIHHITSKSQVQNDKQQPFHHLEHHQANKKSCSYP